MFTYIVLLTKKTEGSIWRGRRGNQMRKRGEAKLCRQRERYRACRRRKCLCSFAMNVLKLFDFGDVFEGETLEEGRWTWEWSAHERLRRALLGHYNRITSIPHCCRVLRRCRCICCGPWSCVGAVEVLRRAMVQNMGGWQAGDDSGQSLDHELGLACYAPFGYQTWQLAMSRIPILNSSQLRISYVS